VVVLQDYWMLFVFQVEAVRQVVVGFLEGVLFRVVVDYQEEGQVVQVVVQVVQGQPEHLL
jgi:hypothetical protein